MRLVRALLGVAVLAGFLGCGEPPKTLPAYWVGDEAAIGARVFANGRQLAVLERRINKDSPFLGPDEVVGCYERGDTVARVGDPYVAQYISMPRNDVDVMVVGRDGDTLKCTAYVSDSPDFTVYMRCKILDYPGGVAKPNTVRGVQ